MPSLLLTSDAGSKYDGALGTITGLAPMRAGLTGRCYLTFRGYSRALSLSLVSPLSSLLPREIQTPIEKGYLHKRPWLSLSVG